MAMKLFFAPASPFTRKVRIVAIEKGLHDRIELVTAPPMKNLPELHRANPMGGIPALLLEDGESLYDSPVICEYLDSLAEKPRLFPASGMERFRALRSQALADGLMEFAVEIVYERRRTDAEISQSVIARRTKGIERTLAAIDAEIADLPETPDIRHIGFGAALGYVSFRLPEINWQKAHPRMKRWYGKFSERPSMKETEPGDS
ncbi:MAG: glutathione S-transferase N-terminal domain-containing protein [Alphaproteobacteria bacterium]|nr:glutathione S-transferase N-terminal domain-containing protein [Alphaproteobacteria bacterium]MCB9975569.1 glutathione S-transferase N-terminal domain-containing protein [Rhodospirillales bacterium]